MMNWAVVGIKPNGLRSCSSGACRKKWNWTNNFLWHFRSNVFVFVHLLRADHPWTWRSLGWGKKKGFSGVHHLLRKTTRDESSPAVHLQRGVVLVRHAAAAAAATKQFFVTPKENNIKKLSTTRLWNHDDDDGHYKSIRSELFVDTNIPCRTKGMRQTWTTSSIFRKRKKKQISRINLNKEVQGNGF